MKAPKKWIWVAGIGIVVITGAAVWIFAKQDASDPAADLDTDSSVQDQQIETPGTDEKSEEPTDKPTFEAPTSFEFTHEIGRSPCPTQAGTIDISSNFEPEGSKLVVVESTLPTWLDFKAGGFWTADLEFNCNLEKYETQTLKANVTIQAQDANGKVLREFTIAVTGTIKGSK